MAVLVDTCVYLDILAEDRRWFEWSSTALAKAADTGTIVLNPIIYAEVSAHIDRIEFLDSFFPEAIFDYQPISKEAAFLAGKRHVEYRKRGGQKLSPLADFFIGAHAAVGRLPLVTRDVKRFSTYFPKLELICP